MVTETVPEPDELAIAALLRALVPAWAHQSPSRIEYLPGGYTNRNYRIDIAAGTYALRIVHHGSPDARERIYLASPAAPDVVAYDPRRGHLLTHWIEGRILDDDRPQPAEAGAYAAHLHRQIPAGVRRYDVQAQVAALLRQATARQATARQATALNTCVSTEYQRMHNTVAQIFERLDWRPTQLRGCHNDLNPWNVMREQSGSFRTLDWETAGDNDPLFDVAGLCSGLDFGAEQTAECAAAYSHEARLPRPTPQRLRQTMTAFRIREYAWAAAQLAADNDRDEIKAQAQSMYRHLTAS